MERTTTAEKPTRTVAAPTREQTPSGSFVRRSAIAGGVSFTVLVVAVLVLTPARAALPTTLASWGLVISGAAITYLAGRSIQRSSPMERLRASRRTQRWLDKQRG